ncbi:MAG: adenine deaminase [Paludibacteraceae bacterium]|nr:adenine deaminase [Paludibacteraceae bacterium]
MYSIICHVADVLNRRFRDAEITVDNGKIASINDCEVPKNVPYVLPGFIDSHVHIESTLLTPKNYARLAVRQGTVAAVCDPHEIANVLGKEGIEFMLRSAAKTRFKFAFGVPSCVPSTPFETAGATLTAEDVDGLLATGKFYGLAEMMNFPGVLMDDPSVKSKINSALERGLRVDGHAPGLNSEDSRKYVAAGITTDHEMFALDAAQERVDLGQKIQIREGSAACNLEALWSLLCNDRNRGKLMFCTDDKYPDELLEGYINELVARSIAHGADLWNVLEAACVNPVAHYGLNVGLLREGDDADFILVDNLTDFTVLKTFINGVCVFGGDDDVVTNDENEEEKNKFHERRVSVDELQVPCREGKMKVIEASEGELYTGLSLVEAKRGVDGMVMTDVDNDILKIVVVNRYETAKPAVAFIRGFGLKRGAIASTIGHDSHNLIAIGCTDQEILTAIMTLEKSHGGLCIVDGEEVNTLPLTVAGLMSPESGEVVGRKHQELKQKAAEIGCKFNAPFMTLAFMALPVIPELKLTDKGLFDVNKFGFTELFV